MAASFIDFLNSLTSEPAPKKRRKRKGDYESPPGRHRHECSDCGHVWEHDDDELGHFRAHACPVDSCRGGNFHKYAGPKKPDTVA